LVSFLVARGHRLLGVEPNAGGGRAIFVLEESTQLADDVSAFLNRKALIEPRALLETLRTLKSAVQIV
jgi:hypothetical protein